MIRSFTYFSILLALSFGWVAKSSAEEERVLYLGGSHSLGVYGYLIDGHLRDRGLEVVSIVDGEAGPYHWLKAYQSFSCVGGYWQKSSTSEKRINSERIVPKLETMIAQHNPDVVIVQTEWNLYATLRSPRRLKQENRLEVRFLIDEMCKVIKQAGAKAYFILPPHCHEKRYSAELQAELKTLMTAVIEDYDYEFFDSGKVTRYTEKYPETDGVSYSEKQYEEWASLTLRDLSSFIKTTQQASKSPIRPIKPLAVMEREQTAEPVPQLDPESDIETDND